MRPSESFSFQRALRISQLDLGPSSPSPSGLIYFYRYMFLMQTTKMINSSNFSEPDFGSKQTNELINLTHEKSAVSDPGIFICKEHCQPHREFKTTIINRIFTTLFGIIAGSLSANYLYARYSRVVQIFSHILSKKQFSLLPQYLPSVVK